MEKAKRKLYIITGLNVLSIACFFGYGHFFNIWGKKFYELQAIVNLGFVLIFLGMFIMFIVSILAVFRYNKLYGRLEYDSKTTLVTFILILVFLTAVQIFFLPWKAGLKPENGITISLGKHPLWNPPTTVKINDEEIKVHAGVDMGELVAQNTYRFLIIIIFGVICYVRALKQERITNHKRGI